MSVWAAAHLAGSLTVDVFGDLARSLAWLAYLAVAARAAGNPPERWVTVSQVLLGLLALGAATATVLSIQAAGSALPALWLTVALCVRLLFPICGIIYLHNLYGDANGDTGSGFRLVVPCLAILWAYDLNLYTVALLGYDVTSALMAGRPLVALVLAPAFAIAARRREHWKIALSRKATFQSLSLMAIGLYFVAMSLSARVTSLLAGDLTAVLATLTAILLCAVAAVLLFIPICRAWLKVIVTKHLFSHRYDYRTEWLRFSATIADARGSSLTLEERAVKAIAEVTESPAGLLLRPGDDAYTIAASWHWPDRSLNFDSALRLPPAIEESLRDGLIASLSGNRADVEGAQLLDWAKDAWVAVPLIRLSSMIGIVVLSRPQLQRELDWEDFDLLKAIGQQAAVHISDTHNQSELDEAKQFEEFNKRFAYIIHDIKNIVSQLSLLVSNAQQHGSNPKFQIEMHRSLSSAVDKMTRLLGRLSPDRLFQVATAHPIDVASLVGGIATARLGQHPVAIGETAGVRAIGDPDKLRIAIEHLVQNAIEASPPNEPVLLASRRAGTRCLITVTDQGVGISPEFIRRGLFRPFVSTKGGGFGIGTAEAKSMVEEMGGKLRISSIEGRGSTFTIELQLDDSTN